MLSHAAYPLGSDVRAPATARAFLRRADVAWSEDVLDVALLATSELVTNAVRHGAGEVTLVLTSAGDVVRIEVQDGGDTPVPGPLGPRGRPGGVGGDVSGTDDDLQVEEGEGGRGLSIVDAVATRWGVVQAPGEPGVTVWLELDLTD